MINREMRTVKVYPVQDVNRYGQSITSADYYTIEMVVKDYSHSAVSDIRYEDVEKIGLTKATIKSAVMIEIDDVKYSILYFIPSGRYNQVFMKKV